jgi:hypothetical protein
MEWLNVARLWASWRMLSNREQGASEIDQPWPVEAKGLDGGATNRGDTKNQREVIIPGEVLGPRVLSWMVERYHCARGRIAYSHLVVLVVIATLTR